MSSPQSKEHKYSNPTCKSMAVHNNAQHECSLKYGFYLNVSPHVCVTSFSGYRVFFSANFKQKNLFSNNFSAFSTISLLIFNQFIKITSKNYPI
jgi:hypothetical protein